jgi:hypothetical protein
MVGYGGRNILPTVKKSLDKFIDQLGKGDSITFITFDVIIKIYPTVYVTDENDKDILKKYISVVEAKGPWTFTHEMIRSVFKKVAELEDKSRGRERVIVVLTDGIDDPPPEARGKRLNIKEISKEYNKKDWFIYLVNLGDLKNNPRMAKLQKDLAANVTKYTKVVDAGDAPAKVIEKDLIKDVQKDIADKKESERTFLSSPYFFAVLCLLGLAALFFLARRFMQLKVVGRLDYWDNTVMEPYIKSFDMGKLRKREITIGRGSGASLKITDIDIPEPFKVIARRAEGGVRCSLQWGNSYSIDFINKEHGEFIADGDVFKVGNYTFRYNYS